MIRMLPFIAYVLLAAYCIADALQHPDTDPYNLPKWAWVIIILLFPYIGGAAWIYLKVSRGYGPGQNRQGPLAPDDDPEYLTWLREQERRKRQQGEK